MGSTSMHVVWSPTPPSSLVLRGVAARRRKNSTTSVAGVSAEDIAWWAFHESGALALRAHPAGLPHTHCTRRQPNSYMERCGYPQDSRPRRASHGGVSRDARQSYRHRLGHRVANVSSGTILRRVVRHVVRMVAVRSINFMQIGFPFGGPRHWGVMRTSILSRGGLELARAGRPRKYSWCQAPLQLRSIGGCRHGRHGNLCGRYTLDTMRHRLGMRRPRSCSLRACHSW